MIIFIPADDFLKNLFSDVSDNEKEVLKRLQEFYKVGSVLPNVTIKGEFFKIELDLNKVEIENTKHSHLLNLCENGEFNKALPYAKELVILYPTESEYYRILGQIYSELDEQEEAINVLIDSLRWNPQNEWALLMMGNILVKHKNDIDSALVYYNQILKHTPDNYITLNNIGAVLKQIGKNKEALTYFQKASEINPNYPNTALAIGLIEEEQGNYFDSFNYALNSIKNSNKTEEVYDKSLGLAISSALKYSEDFNDELFINKAIKDLSIGLDKKIVIEQDDKISTAAKIEFAENYNRDFHLVKFKSNYESSTHLILHELMHLKLVSEARSVEENMLFTTNESGRIKFEKSIPKFKDELLKKGIDKDSVTIFIESLFTGLNSQVFNTPIDLFIEDRINNNFKTIKPQQFLSLLRFVKEGISATTHKDIVSNVPKKIVTISKVYNLVNAIYFKNLFFIDLISEFKASKSELNLAYKFYEEFLEYRLDKKEGEEYELIQHWGEDLKFDAFFNLIPELEHKRKTIDEVIDSINKDPYGLDEKDKSKDRKMKLFLDEHSTDEINKAVVMYMIDAINYFKNLSPENIKKIAFEIATVGMTGIDPNKNGYSIPSIKGSNFSGYKTLAYYYTSWEMGVPEMLNNLQLPFDSEYKLAQSMIKL